MGGKGTLAHAGQAWRNGAVIAELLQNLESQISQMGEIQLFASLILLTFLQEDSVLLLCAALVARGSMSFEMAFWANSTGVLVGDFLLYGIGAGLGRFRQRLWIVGRILKPERVALGQKLFARWGFWIVILSKFTPALRTPLYLSMGFLRSGFWSFALAISLSGILWILFILKGVLKAEELGVLPGFVALLLIGIIASQIVSWRYRKRIQDQKNLR
jgi:membrane protein DedA with SNARE-associated domain